MRDTSYKLIFVYCVIKKKINLFKVCLINFYAKQEPFASANDSNDHQSRYNISCVLRYAIEKVVRIEKEIGSRPAEGMEPL